MVSRRMAWELHKTCLNYIDSDAENYFLKSVIRLYDQILEFPMTKLSGYVNLSFETDRLLNLKSEATLGKLINLMGYAFSLIKYLLDSFAVKVTYLLAFLRKLVVKLLRKIMVILLLGKRVVLPR